MPIFELNNNKLKNIKEIDFSLERDIQRLTEENLDKVFNLDFISTEFALNNFRIDTLAFDKESKSFVIIEYKRGKSYSVVDQGYSYLALMLNNKADFILEYNEKNNKSLKKIDIDWGQSKVIFVANSFTPYQRNAINFKDLPIELWEAKKYSNNTVLYEQVKPAETNESINTISEGNTVVKNVSKEVRKYTIEDHFKPDWEESRNLFNLLAERIFEEFPDINQKINKRYIAYKVGSDYTGLASVKIYKSKLDVGLIRVEKGDLKDPENKVQKIDWKKRGWGKESNYVLQTEEDIEYAIFLIKQIYNKFYK